MALISIDIGANGARIQDAFAAEFNYQPTIDGAPNPESKGAFTKRKVAEWVKEVVKRHEGDAARTAAAANVDSTVTIT